MFVFELIFLNLLTFICGSIANDSALTVAPFEILEYFLQDKS